MRLWVALLTAALALGCSGRAISLDSRSDGSVPAADAFVLPDLATDGAPVDLLPDVAPDVGFAPCEPHSDGTPWCPNEPISVPPEALNAEPALSVDSETRAVAGWISSNGFSYDIVAAGSPDGFESSTQLSPFGSASFDPALAIKGERTFLAWLTVDGVNSTLWVAYSDDGGLEWSSPVQVNDSTNFHDRPWVSVAPTGHVVIGWKESDRIAGDEWLRIAWSPNDGAVFNSRLRLAPPFSTRRSPPQSPVSFAADGAWVWTVIEWTATDMIRIRYLRSTNDGNSFVESELDSWAVPAGELGGDENQQRHLALSYQTSVAAASGPVYVAYMRPTGVFQRDLYATYSADGETFAAAIKVNDDRGTVSHMLPQQWIVADEEGGAHVGWYEERDLAWGVYASSTVDGRSWSEVVPVSDELFVADDWGPLLEQDGTRWPGHFFGLSAYDGYLYAAFGDIRTGQSLIYFSRTAYPVY